MLSLLDLLFSPHEDDVFFVAVCEELDRDHNPLTKEERLEAYKSSVDHFHCLTRNYTAWWKSLHRGIRIDNAIPAFSLYNVVLTAFKQRIDGMPTEVAEGNYALIKYVENEHKAQALNLFMIRMIQVLHADPAARLAS